MTKKATALEAPAKDWEDLAALVGKDMYLIQRDLGVLCANQQLLLDEIRLLRNEQMARLETLKKEGK